MNEEIKEMLWKIKRQNTYDDIGYFKTPLSNDDADKLLNYITNLQKENEKLKDTIKKDNHLLGCNFSKKDKYKQERDIYKQRNEKAIEYLKSLMDGETKKLYRTEDAFKNISKEQAAKNELVLSMIKTEMVLNILQGDDEE